MQSLFAIRSLFALSLVLVAAEPAMATSSCARFAASDINVTYDPLGAQGVSQVVQPISLRAARNSGSGSSTVIAQFVDWDSNTTLRIGSRGPIYTIEDDSTVVTNRYGAALLPNQYFSHTFQSNKSDAYEPVHGLQFFIDPGQDIPAGVYDETLDVQYRCPTGNPFDHSTEWQSGVLHVSVNVPSKLVANLSGGSTSGTLDFGDFNDHARGAMVNVYSTGPFSINWTTTYLSKMLDSPEAEFDADGTYDFLVNAAGLTPEQAADAVSHNHIAARFYHDVQLKFRAGADDRFEFFVGVNNVFDRKPPKLVDGLYYGVPTGTTTAADVYDPFGRRFGVCMSGGQDLNAEMVKAGMALAFDEESEDYDTQMVDAITAGVGLCQQGVTFEEPWVFRRRETPGGFR